MDRRADDEGVGVMSDRELVAASCRGKEEYSSLGLAQKVIARRRRTQRDQGAALLSAYRSAHIKRKYRGVR